MIILPHAVKYTLPIHLSSFGFKGGVPKADMILDCRVVSNPHHIEELRDKGGDHPDVITHVRTASPAYLNFLELIEEAVSRIPSRRRDEVDPYARPFHVACGCAYGVHRSVAMKYILCHALKQRGWIYTEVK